MFSTAVATFSSPDLFLFPFFAGWEQAANETNNNTTVINFDIY
jgi:hypothetical protein